MLADALVLGADGTFGHLAAQVLSARSRVLAASRSPRADGIAFDALDSDTALGAVLEQVKPAGLVINAVGILASEIAAAGREHAVAINAYFPHRLAHIAGTRGLRVVHISTDAVFPSLAGRVDESDPIGPQDIYGITKAAGELLEPHCVTLRCSIVGPPAPHRQRGLWTWIAGQPQGSRVRGYSNQLWSGLTTLQLAQTCLHLLDSANFARARQEAAIQHLAPNPELSKLELVRTISAVIRPDIVVEPGEAELRVDRRLTSRYTTLGQFTPRYANWSDAIVAVTLSMKQD
jgi:dTDP-4-dehydrorhamnose reductase